jgi:hypothetical protein
VKLRPELMPPPLDEAKVQRLAGLASEIDGARPGEWQEALAEFNREAGTSLAYRDFQGIYGGTTHEAWVRSVLAEPWPGTPFRAPRSVLPPLVVY